jgi:hypothetical protein
MTPRSVPGARPVRFENLRRSRPGSTGSWSTPAATGSGHTSDGRNWQAVPSDQLKVFERVSLSSIVAGPNGYVAVGSRENLSYPNDDHPWSEGVAFHSFDGLTWTQAGFRDGGKVSQGTHTLSRPVATSKGYVALHYQEDGYAPNVWYSADGLVWDRTYGELPFECGGAPDLAAGSEGILAYCAGVGWSSDGIGPPILEPDHGPWVSADGKTWSRAPADCPYWAHQSWVAGDGTRIVVVSGGNVYWSSDTRTWTLGASTPELASDPHWAGSSDASLTGPILIVQTRGADGSHGGVFMGRASGQ